MSLTLPGMTLVGPGLGCFAIWSKGTTCDEIRLPISMRELALMSTLAAMLSPSLFLPSLNTFRASPIGDKGSAWRRRLVASEASVKGTRSVHARAELKRWRWPRGLLGALACRIPLRARNLGLVVNPRGRSAMSTDVVGGRELALFNGMLS
jgi:hypothetical protein